MRYVGQAEPPPVFNQPTSTDVDLSRVSLVENLCPRGEPMLPFCACLVFARGKPMGNCSPLAESRLRCAKQLVLAEQ